MADADPKLWGEPQALENRTEVAAEVEKHGFEWANIAQCGGTPPLWEVALRTRESEKLYVFRISGARATELRMLNIRKDLTPSCAQQDLKTNVQSLGTELPW
jgi:hypothetical protein